MNALQRQELIHGAKMYAAADKSDPFAARRCMAHINSGIASVWSERNGNVVMESGYQAEVYEETRRLPDGRQYQITQYRNMKRP